MKITHREVLQSWLDLWPYRCGPRPCVCEFYIRVKDGLDGAYQTSSHTALTISAGAMSSNSNVRHVHFEVKSAGIMSFNSIFRRVRAITEHAADTEHGADTEVDCDTELDADTERGADPVESKLRRYFREQLANPNERYSEINSFIVNYLHPWLSPEQLKKVVIKLYEEAEVVRTRYESAGGLWRNASSVGLIDEAGVLQNAIPYKYLLKEIFHSANEGPTKEDLHRLRLLDEDAYVREHQTSVQV